MSNDVKTDFMKYTKMDYYNHILLLYGDVKVGKFIYNSVRTINDENLCTYRIFYSIGSTKENSNAIKMELFIRCEF